MVTLQIPLQENAVHAFRDLANQHGMTVERFLSERLNQIVAEAHIGNIDAAFRIFGACAGGIYESLEVDMKFGREDELESDRLGVRFMAEAGYDPHAMIEVMRILEEASGGAGPPEFFSTHPNPDNRIARIEEAIQEQFPGGAPEGLKP